MAERVPHPALRRLWSLGAAPSGTLGALERPGGKLGDTLEPELDVAERSALAALAPLLSVPWGTGNDALEQALERHQEAGEDEGAAVTGARSAGAEVAGEARTRRVRPRPAPRSIAPPGRTRLEPPSPGARPEGLDPEPPPRHGHPLPPRGAAPGHGGEATTRARHPGGAGERPGSPVNPVPAGSARAAGEATAVPEGSPAPGARRPASRFPEPARSLDAEALERMAAPAARPAAPERTAARPAAAPDARPRGRRLVSRGAGSPRRRAESLSRSGARQGLERRAERAGAGLALATPVRTEAAGEARAALLARTLAPAPDGAAAEIAPSPRTTPGRPAPVANALERPPGHPGAPAAGEPAPREAAPRLVGLAGLAARAAAASPAPLPGPAPAAAIPAVLAERMEEAQLARRLDRLLRREAEQAGVDLEGLEP